MVLWCAQINLGKIKIEGREEKKGKNKTNEKQNNKGKKQLKYAFKKILKWAKTKKWFFFLNVEEIREIGMRTHQF